MNKLCVTPRRLLILIFVLFFLATYYLVFLEFYEKKNVIEITKNNTEINSNLKSLLKCQDQRLKMQTLNYGNYWVLKNLIPGQKSVNMDCSKSITFTTHGDYTYMYHVAILAMRWLGPISVALYAPGYDFVGTMTSIQYARYCIPESEYIRDYVTFHIYFPTDHMYEDPLPSSTEEALLWPYNCSVIQAPYEFLNRSEMYRLSMNLTYPINVGRNIARRAANTYFVLHADIELYPSLNFIEKFLQMAEENISLVLSTDSPRVFPLPVFQLDEMAIIPDIKDDLLVLLDVRFARIYEDNYCKSCHEIPKFIEWLSTNDNEKLQIFYNAKRYDALSDWLPVYVSDNQEPEFDERIGFKHQCSRCILHYAMCLQNYEYHILHPAFLVHARGFKDFTDDDDVSGSMAVLSGLVENTIVEEYDKLFGENDMCEFNK